MNKCKCCKKEIPLNHVQIDGLHMACEYAYNEVKSEKLIRIKPVDGGPWLVCYPSELREILGEEENGSSFMIERVDMSRGQVERLEEFGGW